MTEEEKNELIEMLIKTETAQKLYDMLYKIWANYDFVFGVMMDLKGDESKQKMIKLIDNGLIDTDEIILNSMAIERNIEVEEMREMINSIDWSKRQVFHREPKE